MSLTSCSGCTSSLISLDVFPQFLERTKLVYFPFILDTEEIEDCDFALIEGCVSEPHQVDILKNVRKHAKSVYALGTCAAFGGILSLSEKKDAEPISNYIEIDGYIPGCAPPSKLLGNCLIRLIENKDIVLPKKNMCMSCPLRGKMDLILNRPIIKMIPDPSEILTEEEETKCLLRKGILCLGPITREGCENKCIKFGMPCEGCLGPVSKDYVSNIVNFLSLINLSHDLKKYKGLFYRFSKPNIKR